MNKSNTPGYGRPGDRGGWEINNDAFESNLINNLIGLFINKLFCWGM